MNVRFSDRPRDGIPGSIFSVPRGSSLLCCHPPRPQSVVVCSGVRASQASVLVAPNCRVHHRHRTDRFRFAKSVACCSCGDRWLGTSQCGNGRWTIRSLPRDRSKGPSDSRHCSGRPRDRWHSPTWSRCRYPDHSWVLRLRVRHRRSQHELRAEARAGDPDDHGRVTCDSGRSRRQTR